MSKPKLLWHSNSPIAPTGYGQQTATFAPLLAEHFDIGISAFYGLEGGPINWRGVPVLPGMGGEYGNTYLTQHARSHFQGDVRDGMVLTLMDVWVLDPQKVAQLNAACWVPVDHEPAPPAVMRFFHESGAVPLAMSRFGEEQLAEFGPLYVPHGIDVDAFKPRSWKGAREALGIPEDSFVVGMVAANKGRPSRKGFQQAFEAFRYLREKHDNAVLYLHTILSPQYAQGEDIPALLASLQIPEESVRIANQYRSMFLPWSHEEMSSVYSAFDVLVNPAAGEGFGIPILEAQACGVPAVVTDFSAMKEVCGAGWKIPGRGHWTGQKSWQAIPDVAGILGAFEECYEMPSADRAALSQKARKHALQYAAPRVLEEHLLPALEKAQERFDARKPIEVAA